MSLQPSSPGVWTVLTPVVISHLTGVALYLLPVHLQETAVEHFPVSETEAVVLTAIAIYTAGLALPHNTQRCTHTHSNAVHIALNVYSAAWIMCLFLSVAGCCLERAQSRAGKC